MYHIQEAQNANFLKTKFHAKLLFGVPLRVAASSRGIWALRSWYFALLEDGTLVPKQVGETHLMYVLIGNCVVGWCN